MTSVIPYKILILTIDNGHHPAGTVLFFLLVTVLLTVIDSGTLIIRGKLARISRDREMDISEFRGNIVVNFRIFAVEF